MYKVPPDARLEIKFATYRINLDKILSWINAHPAVFVSPFPDRVVNNIYFDTHDNASYVQNLSGSSSRAKVRYRWYGNSEAPSAGVFELKCKRNFFGWKKRFPCRELPADMKRHDWREITRQLTDRLPPEARVWMQSYPVPTILNRYSRRYFVTDDNKVRLTIDTDQAVWDQRYKPVPNYDQQAHLPETLVAEFKFAREDRRLASDIMQTMPIRVSRHSKFMNGLRSVSFD